MFWESKGGYDVEESFSGMDKILKEFVFGIWIYVGYFFWVVEYKRVEVVGFFVVIVCLKFICVDFCIN